MATSQQIPNYLKPRKVNKRNFLFLLHFFILDHYSWNLIFAPTGCCSSENAVFSDQHSPSVCTVRLGVFARVRRPALDLTPTTEMSNWAPGVFARQTWQGSQVISLAHDILMCYVAEQLPAHKPEYFRIWEIQVMAATEDNLLLLHPSFNHADEVLKLFATTVVKTLLMLLPSFIWCYIHHLNKTLIESILSQ